MEETVITTTKYTNVRVKTGKRQSVHLLITETYIWKIILLTQNMNLIIISIKNNIHTAKY